MFRVKVRRDPEPTDKIGALMMGVGFVVLGVLQDAVSKKAEESDVTFGIREPLTVTVMLEEIGTPVGFRLVIVTSIQRHEQLII